MSLTPDQDKLVAATTKALSVLSTVLIWLVAIWVIAFFVILVIVLMVAL